MSSLLASLSYGLYGCMVSIFCCFPRKVCEECVCVCVRGVLRTAIVRGRVVLTCPNPDLFRMHTLLLL